MSRRTNPGADRAEQNRATLKNLVKLESNKTCADCKKNKHPRWASWNLGIFICIRCSGIHRGMGTHISKVKSVDLDSWTDEQLQNVLRWGNGRANQYWESKLASAHIPAEAKMENFIRTKYESKRWVMDGPMPDPSNFEVDDDDMPLKKVQEKVQIERSASQRLAANSRQASIPQSKPQPAIDLFGDEYTPQASSRPPAAVRAPPKVEPEGTLPKQIKAGDSLLGLDFIGGSTATQPARQSDAGPATVASSRPDLKQSILSLYASKPASTSQPQQHAHQTSLGSHVSSQQPQQSQQTLSQNPAFSGMNDAFSSLSFGATTAPKPSPFAGLDSFSSSKPSSSTSSSTTFGGGGNFFDMKPKSHLQNQAPLQAKNPSQGLGNIGNSRMSAPSKSSAPASDLNDLLDLSMPVAPVSASKSTSQPLPMSSAFNLTSLSLPSAPTASKANPTPAAVEYGGFSNLDAWGSNDVWGSSTTAKPITTTTTAQAHSKSPSWGASHVAQDDDFGGWSSAVPVTTAQPSTTTHVNTAQNKSAGGLGGSDDLFSNVWQ